MPIDPSISLSVRPVQLPDLAKSYGEGVQLRNAIQQGQMNAEKLKQEQRTNQMADLDAQDQLKLRDVYSKAGGDPEKTVQGAIQAGVSPKSVQGLQQHFADYAEKVAKTKSDELATDKYKADQMLGLHDQAIQLAQTNPQAYAAAWPQLYAEAVKAEPDAAKHLDPNTPPTVDQLQLSKAGYVTHTSFLTAEEEKRKQAEEVRKQSEEGRKAALAVPQLAEAGAKAASSLRQEDANTIAQAAKQGGPPAIAAAIGALPPERRAPFAGLTGKEKPEDILAIGTTPAEQITTGRMASTAAEAARHNKIEEGQGASRVAISKQEQQLRQKQFDSTYGALVDPNTGKSLEPEAAKAVASQDPLAVAVANYQTAPPPVGRGGPGASILRKALAINPDYDAKSWQAQGGLLKDFTSGKSSQELVAINTALGHVGVLNQAVDALKNGDIRVLNAIGNRFGLETGTSPAAAFRTIVNRVGPELVKAYSGSGGGQQERLSAEHDFDPNLSPQILKNNIATTAKLLDSKIKAKQQQWEGTFKGRPLPFGLTTEAKDTMQSLTGKGDSVAVPEVTSQADYDKLPKGAKYTNNGVPHVKQ